MPFNPAGFTQAEYIEPASTVAFDSANFGRSVAFGVAGAIAGAIVYAAFIGITHIQIGYLSIGIAWLVAKAMEIASRGRGGRPYQIAAVVLTLLAVALGNSILLWWDIRGEGIALSAHNVLLLARYGFEKPFLRFGDSPFGALLGLFILFIGLRAAWRMTSGVPGAVQHPFSS